MVVGKIEKFSITQFLFPRCPSNYSIPFHTPGVASCLKFSFLPYNLPHPICLGKISKPFSSIKRLTILFSSIITTAKQADRIIHKWTRMNDPAASGRGIR